MILIFNVLISVSDTSYSCMNRYNIIFCFLVLVMLDTSKTEDIGVYWGEETVEGTLAETCATRKYKHVNIDFLTTFRNGSTPEITLADHCDPSSSKGCTFLSSDIRYCQKQGIKVMLSIGGYGYAYNLISSVQAKNVSDYLWNNFFGGNSSSRPLGDAVLDGINIVTDNYSKYWVDLARYLKSYQNNTAQNIYLGAAPLCSFDNSANSTLNNSLFDYLSVRFFYSPVCEYNGENTNNLISSWHQWTKLKVGKIFLELQPEPAIGLSGYIPPDLLNSQIIPLIRKSSNYGGVMLLSRYEDKWTGYSDSLVSPLCGQQENNTLCNSHNINFTESFGYMSTASVTIGESNLLCCEFICRNDCSCDAYAPTDYDSKTGCQVWINGSTFIRPSVSNIGQTIYVTNRHRRQHAGVQSRKRHPVIMLRLWIIIGFGVAITILSILYLSYTSHRKNRRTKADVKKEKDQLIDEIGGNASDEIEIFTFKSMVAATNNFSAANKLGEGGFGSVYMGRLPDKQEIAIKRLGSLGQGLTEFKNEAKVIAKLQHTNLVRLLGLCIQNEERMLVYEYMSNRSLNFHLFDDERKNVLDWEKRLSIIEGIAQGLLYLHKYSRVKVIHRDLKASNVLLDDEMKPKISDFGMARILGLKGSEEKTKRIVGTYGYMCPEAFKGIVSIKTDVFSFGVLMLEILSGKRNNCCHFSDFPLNLIGYAWKLWDEGRALELMDQRLNETCTPPNEVLRCMHIGLLCVQVCAKDRPTMFDVVTFLSNDAIQLAQPKQPAFYINVVDMDKLGLNGNKQEKNSINYVTISVVDGR